MSDQQRGPKNNPQGAAWWPLALVAGAGFAFGMRTFNARGGGAAARANKELQASARRALELKKAAASQHHIPEHRTSHEGGVRGAQVPYTDARLGREPAYTANLKRSHNARTGDAGR